MSDSNEEDRFEYGDDIPKPSVDALKRLGQLAAKMGLLELECMELEEQLKKKQDELRQYSENLVPELMAEVGLSELTTAGGLRVEMREEVRASFPKDEAKRARAIAWLTETGNDGLVKREFSIRYGRDSTEWADKFLELLREHDVGEHATVEHDLSIHHQTLVAFLRKEREQGHNVPMDAFGAFVQKFARIKRGKR